MGGTDLVLQRECGWCGAVTFEATRTNCLSCGGPLPAHAASVVRANPELALSVAPPPAPRTLPAGYENRVRYWRNVFVILGIVFTVLLFWTLIFPAIGIPFWVIGHRRADRKIRALKYGTPVEGAIVRVAWDTSVRINHQHPLKISYVFDTPRGTREGWTHAWDAMLAMRQPGERIWVVYDPRDDAVNEIWPPIR